jgi:hypothetical protein
MQQTETQPEIAEIGKTYHTAIIWVSRNRYTYATTDGNYSGHCTEPDERRFRRALSLEIYCLHEKGYFTRIHNTTIEG